MKTIAVMQPYFVPYAGYFRIFAAADMVVMFDCVQFPRRGWVHRNRFVLASGEHDWLTLPLQKAAFDARIDDLRFRLDAVERLKAAARRFPLLDRAIREKHPLVARVLELDDVDVASYLCRLVYDIAASLAIERPVVRSSTLHIDRALRAQDRVIAIVKALGGTRYVNPPGGRALYDQESFSRAGLELRFLTPYSGSAESVLSRLICEQAGAVAAEIRGEATLVA